MPWDYIIIGGGRGSELAARLPKPRNPSHVLEAGPRDRHPFYHCPRASRNDEGDRVMGLANHPPKPHAEHGVPLTRRPR